MNTSRNQNPDAATARATRAVVYLRVSTKDQAERGGEAEGFSIPAQREACGRKAKSLDAVVVEEFIDAGESAKTAHRPELQRMLKYVAENDVRYVIVHKVDRLARNRLDDALINMEISKAGAALVSCTENIDETPSGALMHGIMSSIAEFYSRNLANEVIKGSVEKAKKGGTVGRAPTGYLNVRKYENGVETRTVEIDPERGPLMAWAFDAYATGQWTLRRLLEEVTRRGLTSPPTRRTPPKPLVLSNFHRLLRHPYYKGIVRYRGVEYPGKHEPLVDPQTWQRVQEVLESQFHAGERQREHPHYLKGTIYCGSCGSRLIVSKNRGQNGKLYEYFVCLGRHTKLKACLQRAVLIELVEAKVEDHYEFIQPPAELLERIRSVLSSELATGRAFAEKERSAQFRRIRKLEDERTKLLDGYYAGAIPVDLMKREQTRIGGELKHAKDRLDAMSAEFDRVESNLEAAIALASTWHDAYLRATPTERRLLNQAIFEKLYVDQHGGIVHQYTEPFEFMLSESTVSTVIERVDAAELTPEQSEAIDRAWADLSAQWAAEEAASRVRAIASGTPISQNEQTPENLAVVGGSNKTLMVDGRVIKNYDPRSAIDAGIAFVPADRKVRGTVGPMTVRENLTLSDLTPHFVAGRLQRKRERDETHSWIHKLSIKTPGPEAAIGALSGGNQQKVMFGKALRLTPKVLLLAEPTQGIDIGAKDQIHSLIDQAAQEGVATFVASTDTDELVRLCHRVLVIVDGQIVAEISGSDITAEAIEHTQLQTSRRSA